MTNTNSDRPIYNFHPGVGGGINQHMSKERRREKHKRHTSNSARRMAVSKNETPSK